MNIDKIISEANPSMNHIELKAALEHIGSKKIKTGLEIGVHMGGSMKVWRKVFNPEILIGIDPDIHAIDHEVMRQEYIVVARSQEPDTIVIIEDLLKWRPLDFLFIDGDHNYEAVKDDFLNYIKFCELGSIVMFHDIALKGKKWEKKGVGVYRFWQEVKKRFSGQYREFYQPPDGTGIGVLRL